MPIIARLVPVVAVAAALAALAGCAGVGTDAPGGRAPGAVAEQARLRLTDQCMYEAAKTANMLKDKIAPRCQCYARGALRQMSASDISSVAAGGSVPFSVRSQEIMNACASRVNAFDDAPRRPRTKKRPASEAPAPNEPPPANEAPAPADVPPPAPQDGNPPPPPAGGGELPKSP